MLSLKTLLTTNENSLACFLLDSVEYIGYIVLALLKRLLRQYFDGPGKGGGGRIEIRRLVVKDPFRQTRFPTISIQNVIGLLYESISISNKRTNLIPTETSGELNLKFLCYPI